MANDSLLSNLESVVGPRGILTGSDLSGRTSGFWNEPVKALALVRPDSVDQVSKLLAICNDRRQPVVTSGGGTGLVGGSTTQDHEILLSTERLRTIEDIDPLGRTMRAQSGCILETVQNAAQEQRLRFPLDLGARGSCTIGGNLATNAGGIAVIRHGMARDLVLGVEAVLADGTVVSSLHPFVKNNTGYDLTNLLIGSEGTLGVITRAILKLKSGEQKVETALVGCGSFQDVVGLLNFLRDRSGEALGAFEVLWGDYFKLVADALTPGRSPLALGHRFYVLLETESPTHIESAGEIEASLERAMKLNLIDDAVVAKSERQRRDLWVIREDTEVVSGFSPMIIYDVALAVRDMTAYLDELRAKLRQRWSDSLLYVWGHLGDGNLHLGVSAGRPLGEDADSVDELVFATLSNFGGSVSAEHGVGVKRKAYLGYTRSLAEVRLMKTIKRALDPANILNPGKLFDLDEVGDVPFVEVQ